MNQELMEVVAKHLPAMQMEVLKDELKKVEKIPSLEEKISKLDKENQELFNANKKLLVERDEYQKANQTLREKADQVQKSEIHLNAMMLTKDVECERSKAQLTKDLFFAAFKNPVFQRSIHETIPMKNPNTGYTDYENRTFGETKSVQDQGQV